jgi:rhamnulokinase
MPYFLAIDLGAESGRAILADLDPNRLQLQEIHRFPNQPVWTPQGLFWDALRLHHEILEALRIVAAQGIQLQGIAVDTWGVDFALLNADGSLAECPRCYRDPRTNGILDEAFSVASPDEIFAQTGIQFMAINSLYQLHSLKRSNAASLHTAQRLLFMPDLLNYWLCGEMANEVSIASTSQLFNPTTRDWAWPLIENFGLPKSWFGRLVSPGTRLGSLLPYVQKQTGLGPVPVFTTGCHDTASAVAAVPAAPQSRSCYISSGTWSLMGVLSDLPVINPLTRQLNYTNEMGTANRVRLLKNIAGLWPLQECRRTWQRQGLSFTYQQLAEQASTARAHMAKIDPDQFLDPGDMPQRIQAACRDSGQGVPQSPGEITRVILESLAQRYAEVLTGLEQIVDYPIETIHIVGGGAQNSLLNQMTANATKRMVIAGPFEATAIGNVLIQAIGAGVLADEEAGRQLIHKNFDLERFAPNPSA